MDLTTILVAAALAFGLLSADAVMNADTVAVRLTVPAAVAKTGVSGEVAESIFTNEMQRINQVRSLIQPPAVRSSSDSTLLSVVARALGLQEVTFALQDMFGLSPVRVAGALVAEEGGNRLLLTASSPSAGAFSIEVREAGAADALLRRGAFATMERLTPYRAALHRFVETADAGGTDFSAIEAIVSRELMRPSRPEWIERRALLHNLLGITALMRNDIEDARRFFSVALEKAPDLAVARLNLAFVMVQLDRYAEAIELVRPILDRELTTAEPLLAATHVTWGIAAWGLGDVAEAESRFAQAARSYFGTTAAYEYWAMLLREQGQMAEAEAKDRIGAANQAYFENFAEVAMLYFWMSPKDRQPLRRR